MSVKVAMFCGGTGAGSIATSFLEAGVDLTLIVNAYDDGLSTGALRKAIPGMLGPSDIRKNVARHCALPQFVLNQRINTAEIVGASTLPGDFRVYEEAILDYLRGMKRDIAQCAVGNLLFAGCYLSDGSRNFNRTVGVFSETCKCKCRVINVTTGRNGYLSAFRQNGTHALSEYAISVEDSASPIERILLSSSPAQYRHQVHEANPELYSILREADVIVYGPGTQHSSLLPSYMVMGVAEAILASSALKVYIANAARDHDTPSETVQDLMDKFVIAMTRRGHSTIIVENKNFASFVDLSLVAMTGALSFRDNSGEGLGRAEVSDKWATNGLHHGAVVVPRILQGFQANACA